MITVVGNIFHLVWYFYITVSWVVKDFHLQSADTLICVRNNWIIVFILLHYTLLLFDMVQKLSPELPQPVHLPETHCGSDSPTCTVHHWATQIKLTFARKELQESFRVWKNISSLSIFDIQKLYYNQLQIILMTGMHSYFYRLPKRTDGGFCRTIKNISILGEH